MLADALLIHPELRIHLLTMRTSVSHVFGVIGRLMRLELDVGAKHLPHIVSSTDIAMDLDVGMSVSKVSIEFDAVHKGRSGGATGKRAGKRVAGCVVAHKVSGNEAVHRCGKVAAGEPAVGGARLIVFALDC